MDALNEPAACTRGREHPFHRFFTRGHGCGLQHAAARAVRLRVPPLLRHVLRRGMPLPARWPCSYSCLLTCACGLRQYGEGGGWAIELLNWMNATWPHRGHKLYNMGEPGADVIPTLLSCPQTLLGGIAPDLVLVDVTVNGPEYYERLLRLLLTSWGPPPAVVFTLFGEFSDRKEGGRKGRSASSLLAQLVRAAMAAREVEGDGEAEKEPLARQIVEALHAPPPRLLGVGWDNEAAHVPEAWARSSFLGRTLSHWAKAQAKPLQRLYLWRQYLMVAEVLKLRQACE